jgi:hypothetical protein
MDLTCDSGLRFVLSQRLAPVALADYVKCNKEKMPRAIYKGGIGEWAGAALIISRVCYGPHLAARMHSSIVRWRLRDTKA